MKLYNTPGMASTQATSLQILKEYKRLIMKVIDALKITGSSLSKLQQDARMGLRSTCQRMQDRI